MTVARITGALGALVALAAACADSTTSPSTEASPAPPGPVRTASIGAPDPTNPRSWEGALFICKDANVAGTFSFDFTVTQRLSGTQFSTGTASVVAGTCVKVAQVPTIFSLAGGYLATVTEHALPANWSLTSITSALSQNVTVPPAVIDLAARTTTGQFLHNDIGAVVTFTNTYVAPSGQIGDFVWNDQNFNGVQDVGEPGLSGVTVNLSGASAATAITDANGAYLFSGLSAGSYTVAVDASTVPAGFLSTLTGQGTPATDNNGGSASVTLATSSSQDLTIDFGYFSDPSLPGRMTGGGVKALNTAGETVTFGLTLHCDLILSNNLEVNWGKGQNSHKWHIDKALLKTAKCTLDPSFTQAPPVAPFNTFVGTAYGTLDKNATPSYVTFKFQDAGEPGRNDTVEITIYQSGPASAVVMRVLAQKLTNGNWQMHYDQPHGNKP